MSHIDNDLTVPLMNHDSDNDHEGEEDKVLEALALLNDDIDEKKSILERNKKKFRKAVSQIASAKNIGGALYFT